MGRVVYVLRTFPEPSETFIRNEIRALRHLGVPVSVLAAQKSKPAAEDWTEADARDVPVQVVRYSWRGGTLLRTFNRVLRLRPDAQRDVSISRPRHLHRLARLHNRALAMSFEVPADTTLLHAHFANDAAVMARYLGTLTGLPYRVTAHAYDIYQDPCLLERNLSHAAEIFTVSEANRAELESRLRAAGTRGKTVEVVRCGIDLTRFTYRDPSPPASPARLLCVARFVPKKGHAVLFDAIARLRKEGMDVTLACAGDGPLEATLRTRAAAADLAGAVSFLGTLGHDAIRERMRASDAVVLAARIAEDGDRDGIPVALMEAMALGVPVVSTAVSGLPELVVSGTGRLVAPDRADLLAAAIRETLTAPHDHRIAQARAARARIEAEFDLATIAKRLARIPSG